MNFRTFTVKRYAFTNKENLRRYFSNSTLRNTQFILSHTIYDAPSKESVKAPFLITHGLLGSKNNFNSIAKAVAKATNRQVITFDARNHGESPHADDASYDAMSEDITLLVNHLNIPKFSLMGHSMGGRTVMTFALKNPNLLEKLIVVDMSPITRAMDLSSMQDYIKLLLSIKFDSSVETISEGRKFADSAMKSIVDDAALRAFLLTNLAQTDHKLYWKPNLPILLQSLANIGEFPEHLMKTKFTSPTMFIKGDRSPYVPDSDFPLISKTFINSKLTVMNGSGHWPHADNSTLFLKHVVYFLNE